MEFVVNEWLPEYFLRTATPAQVALRNTFIQKFAASYDRIVVNRADVFYQKLERYEKGLKQADALRYGMIHAFNSNVLRNTLKCRIIHEKLPLPEGTLQILNMPGTNFMSDAYLFEAALHTDSKLIITTDGKLYRAMANDETFQVMLLEDFLKDY